MCLGDASVACAVEFKAADLAPMKRRRKSRLPFAVFPALIFNSALCITPFIGAHAISTAFGDNRPQYEGTSEALAATRKAIETRFQRLTTASEGESRDIWADFVRTELEAGDMTTARAFLLAAPAMLDGSDGDSLKARLAVADGSGDQALIEAAVAYLPEDVQVAYERQSASVVSLFDNAAPPTAIDGAQPAANVTTSSVTTAAAPSSVPVEAPRDDIANDGADDRAEYRVLGDLRDLSLQAARWSRDDLIDEFAFTLAGVGLTLADPEAREGASVLMSARRGKRLEPSFELYIERKLYEAAPPQRLKRLLAGEFQSEFGYGSTGPAVVESAFKSSVDRLALENVLGDLRVIRDIARDTSPSSAVAILSQVKDGADLHRARLVAQAGGDMAVALARYDGEHLLDAARTAINWSNALRMQLAGLAACLAILLLISFNVLWRSFKRTTPVRRSAVYALDEVTPR